MQSKISLLTDEDYLRLIVNPLIKQFYIKLVAKLCERHEQQILEMPPNPYQFMLGQAEEWGTDSEKQILQLVNHLLEQKAEEERKRRENLRNAVQQNDAICAREEFSETYVQQVDDSKLAQRLQFALQNQRENESQSRDSESRSVRKHETARISIIQRVSEAATPLEERLRQLEKQLVQGDKLPTEAKLQRFVVEYLNSSQKPEELQTDRVDEVLSLQNNVTALRVFAVQDYNAISLFLNKKLP